MCPFIPIKVTKNAQITKEKQNKFYSVDADIGTHSMFKEERILVFLYKKEKKKFQPDDLIN